MKCKNCGHEMHIEKCSQVIRYSSVNEDGKEISDYMECCCCEPEPEKEAKK